MAGTRSQKRKLELLDSISRKMRLNDGGQNSSKGDIEDKSNGDDDDPVVMKGNTRAAKATRCVDVGWIHEGVQVKAKTGGGTRRLILSKDICAAIIMEKARNLFFSAMASLSED